MVDTQGVDGLHRVRGIAPSDDTRGESISEQISRAESLLAASLAQLRESLLGLAEADPATPDLRFRRDHLDQAVIALQSEDTVGQLLSTARCRVEQLELCLSRARALVEDIGAATDRLDQPNSLEGSHADRLAALRAVLAPPEALTRTTVSQRTLTPGPTQIF